MAFTTSSIIWNKIEQVNSNRTESGPMPSDFSIKYFVAPIPPDVDIKGCVASWFSLFRCQIYSNLAGVKSSPQNEPQYTKI